PGLPESSVKDLRIAWIENEVCDSSGVVAIKNPSPGFSTVSAFIDASLSARSENVALGSYVDDVGIRRIDAHSRDLSRVGEADRSGAAVWTDLPPFERGESRGVVNRRARAGRRHRAAGNRSLRKSVTWRQRICRDQGADQQAGSAKSHESFLRVASRFEAGGSM